MHMPRDACELRTGEAAEPHETEPGSSGLKAEDLWQKRDLWSGVQP